MLFGKKKKIEHYLKEKGTEFTIFDLVLNEYLSGILAVKLKSIGLTKIEIHVDFFDDIKDLGIQARYEKYYLDIQIDENELAIGCSKTEPDCDEFVEFNGENNTEFIYKKIQKRIEQIK